MSVGFALSGQKSSWVWYVCSASFTNKMSLLRCILWDVFYMSIEGWSTSKYPCPLGIVFNFDLAILIGKNCVLPIQFCYWNRSLVASELFHTLSHVKEYRRLKKVIHEIDIKWTIAPFSKFYGEIWVGNGGNVGNTDKRFFWKVSL